jgi:ectoine hydroxylase-related dioxygenase (phytanoyl-CoA dioxygenase family)
MRLIAVGDVDALVSALNTEGYAVVRGVVSQDRLASFHAELVGEYERARASGELFKGGGSLSGHLNCFPGEASRFIYDEIVDAGIVDVARAIDPTAAAIVRPTLNFNLPGSVTQHYHMDGVFTDAFLICNVAVVDTDTRNGAIDVLPGTNREFYKFWRYALERKYRLSTRINMQQGDVLLRMSTLWHRGMPNTSSTPRPMMSLTFGERGVTEGDPFLANDGKILFYPNWFRTDRLGRARERMFVNVPMSYSAIRFVRSLHGDRGYSSW